MRALAVDFETANEKRSSPCAIGLAWIEDGAVVRREYRLIRPAEMRFSHWNIKVHGIHPQDVRDAPEFPEVIAEFIPAFAENHLIAHNAAFDVGVLLATCELYGEQMPDFSYLCTHLVARRAWPGESRYSLSEVARRIGVQFKHHHAAEDAYACARVALSAAQATGARSLSELCAHLNLQLGSAGAVHDACRSTLGQRPGTLRAPSVRAGRRRIDDRFAHLRFVVRGSTGNEYEISPRLFEGDYRPACNCPAGLNNRRCRHVTALLNGEVDTLLTNNAEHLPAFVRLVCSAVGEGAEHA